MLKYLDFNITEPYREGNCTDITWETFQQYRSEVKISKKFNDYLKLMGLILKHNAPNSPPLI